MSKAVYPSSGARVIIGLLGIAMFGLMITALVLAILGLMEYAKQTGVYVQGKAQAIWALILSMLILFSGAIGFTNGLRKAGANGITLNQGQPGKLLNFADLNFRFRSPERPWVSVDLRQLNKDSTVSFMRRFPEAYFIVIAESLGDGSQISSKQLADIGKAHLESAAASNRIIEETPLRVNGLDGILVEQQAQVDKFQLFYVQWFMATNGYSYQLMGYGKSEDRPPISTRLTLPIQPGMCFPH